MRTAIIVIIIVLLIGIGVYAFRDRSDYTAPDGSQGVVCTMEAKLCPDGSYVGRTGPNCEFSACPGATTTATTTGTSTR